MPDPLIHGLHHVTCIAGDPQENIDFYVGVMGLRLVKKSVNQDVPDTYHFFFADANGTPGTDLTFFPWPDMAPVEPGVGLAMEVVFAVAPGSLGFWRERLAARGAAPSEPLTRFGEPALTLRDPHGLPLALVETARPRPFAPWDKSDVPVEHQLRGMDAVRLWERDVAPTADFLTGVLGLRLLGEEDGWTRFGLEGGGAGALVELRAVPDRPRGKWGTGAVHHVAFRVPDEDALLAARSRVDAAGRRPTPPIDRFWFTSVYFLEPGGVLFEMATDGPGFERDERPDRLGERLILPPWLEPRREAIEQALPRVAVPA